MTYERPLHLFDPRSGPAPKPWLACVLSVDTAENSGWAFWRDGTLVDSGEVDTRKSEVLDALVADFVLVAEPGERAKALVMEKPWGGSTPTVIGLAMARERWERAWKDSGEAMGRIVRVHPSTWRAKVIGKIHGLKRDAIRERELQVAQRIANRIDLGYDESAAIGIGYWGSSAGEVGRVIGARAVQASMRGWKT